VPFSSNVYSINVHLLAFIVLCYPHAFASDPLFRIIYLLNKAKASSPVSIGIPLIANAIILSPMI
ncbi:hypothetical protein ACTNCZ_15235, partial [Segatella copri]|uniref:hypothetical protein n=1 Tax=Segatella copri TaxID=165179 RepID=UPI003F89B630